jgi:hypothetical protein
MSNRNLQIARNIANNLGIEGIINTSRVKGKRFTITRPDGKKISFGVWPYTGEGTFIDHGDEKIKKAWKARHKKILKDNKPAYKNPDSPEYYSWRILWS